MTDLNKNGQAHCFAIAFKSALEHTKGQFFRPWQGLNSLVAASYHIRSSEPAVAEHQRKSIMKLAFEILFTTGHRDLAYRILEEMEADIDRQENLFLECAIEEAEYISKWLLNMNMIAEAYRVASKYVQKIDRRLECSFDPFLDVSLLKDIRERLETIKERATVAAFEYDETRTKVEQILLCSEEKQDESIDPEILGQVCGEDI